MKQIKYNILAGLTMMLMLLVGCTEDNSMTEIPSNNASDNVQQQEELDEVAKALTAIPGISDVKMEYAKSTLGDDEEETSQQKLVIGYYFNYQQPVDHYHPERGTYDQQCHLTFKGYENNVVVLTNGYEMITYDTDLSKHLEANQLSLEHRYFGKSLPEPFENLNMTYFNADQQARDIHRIVSTLKTHLFKTGKWASTGTSKSGITTALQAYYSDLNGWQDFDVYVPFCAPFMTGTTYPDGSFSCNDIATGTYLKDVCGSGYPADSEEAIAFERLRRIPQLVCTNEMIREAAIKACYNSKPSEYAKVVEQYNSKSPMSTGDLKKDLAAFAIYTYYDALFGKFSYIPFSQWAWLVPNLTPLETGSAGMIAWGNFMSFFVMGEQELEDYLHQLQTAEQRATRSATEEQWSYLLHRRQDFSAPYYIQAFMELGANDFDYSAVNGTGYLTETECTNVNYQFTVQYAYSQTGAEGIYKQDNGKLMTDFLRWTETESTQPIIFVYAYNDPWTGAAISDQAAQSNPMIEKVVDAIATHNDAFLIRTVYTKESEQKIVNALNRFLK